MGERYLELTIFFIMANKQRQTYVHKSSQVFVTS